MPWTKFKCKFLDNVPKSGFVLTDLLASVVPGLKISDTIPAHSHTIVSLSTPSDLDKLLTDSSKEKLASLNMQVIPLQSTLVEKTVFIPKINHHISSQDPSALVNYINSSNSDLKATKVACFKGSNPRIDRLHLKVTFQTVTMAKTVIESGFYIGTHWVDADHIFPEEFIEVPQCFRCFSFNHPLSQCPSEHKYCNQCAGKHSYRQCDSTFIKCMNCGEKHRATSNSCQIRKAKIIEIKANRANLRTNQSTPAQFAPPPSVNPWSAPAPSTLSATTPNPSSSAAFPALPSNPTPSSSSHQRPTPASKTHQPPTPVSTVHQPPIQTQVPTRNFNQSPSSTPLQQQFKNNQWQMHLDIWKETAKMTAKGEDPTCYLNAINQYFAHYNLDPVPILPPPTVSNQNPSPSQSQPLSPPPISPTTQAQALPSLQLTPSNPPSPTNSISSTPNHGIPPPTPLMSTPVNSPSPQPNFNLHASQLPSQLGSSDPSKTGNLTTISERSDFSDHGSQGDSSSSLDNTGSPNSSRTSEEGESEDERVQTSSRDPRIQNSVPLTRARLRGRSSSVDSIYSEADSGWTQVRSGRSKARH